MSTDNAMQGQQVSAEEVSRIQTAATERLDAVIHDARYQCGALDPELHLPEKWDAPFWEAPDGPNGATRRLYFTCYDTGRGTWREAAPMEKPYVAFARAYIRLLAGDGVDHLFHYLTALRCLERALVLEGAVTESGGADVTKSDMGIFDLAEELLLKKRAESSRSSCIYALSRIADFLNRNCLLLNRFTWNRVATVYNPNNRVGPEAEKRREEKLLSDEVLMAMADAFALASDPPANLEVTTADVIVSSVLALLASAPMRIDEVLRLSVNGEVDVDEDGDPAHGFRWYSSKVRSWSTKWTQELMDDVARKAFANIKAQTERGRLMAEWYEKYPNKIYLPKELTRLRRKKVLTSQNVADLLGFAKANAVTTWAQQHKVKRIKKPGPHGGKQMFYPFAEVQRVILKMLPKRFPVADRPSNLRFSEALFVVPHNALFGNRTPSPCMFTRVSYGSIIGQIAAKGKNEKRAKLWERLDLKMPDGSPIEMSTHQVRHLLTTMAIDGNMDPLHMAMWANRDIDQNACYIHIHDYQIIRQARKMGAHEMRMTGEIAAKAKVIRRVVGRDEFDQIMVASMTVTPIGFCNRNWAKMTCQNWANCLNCPQHLFCKQGRERTAEMRRLYEDRERQLTMALAEQEEEAKNGNEPICGLDRGVEVLRDHVEKLRTVVEWLEDPNVKQGSWMAIIPKHEFSRTEVAMMDRMQLGGPDAEILKAVLTAKKATLIGA